MSRMLVFGAVILTACGVDLGTANQRIVATHHIYEDASGRWQPFAVDAQPGDDVVWHFPAAGPGNSVARRAWTGSGWAIAPYDPSAPNDFTGPMITAPAGVFALGPEGNGLEVSATRRCASGYDPVAQRTVGMTTQYLCRSIDPVNYGRTLELTWSDPAITGVFIRLHWRDLQPTKTTWDDTILEREIDAAVAHGKLYSLVLESGRDGQPPWLFTALPNGAGLDGYVLDWNDDDDTVCRTDQRFIYADPTTATYRSLYLAALTHVAEVIKRKGPRYRALAYIKVSGANRATGENRLPTRCKPGCDVCNNAVWSRAHYQPSNLYAFYAAQIQHLAALFPGKSINFMLIQAGFPRVGEGYCYMGADDTVVCPADHGIDKTVPRGTEQMEHVVETALQAYPSGRFIPEHQGLDTNPASVNPWVHDYGRGTNAAGLPNQWAPVPTMFQTSASGQVGDPVAVGTSLETLWSFSDASAIELYEERIWEANGAALGGDTYPDATIGDWNRWLQQRRGLAFFALGDPAPTAYTFRLAPVTPPGGMPFETMPFVDPRAGTVPADRACTDGSTPCLRVEPLGL